MRKLNLAIATLALLTITTVLLSSCHRNTCPTFSNSSQDTEQNS